MILELQFLLINASVWVFVTWNFHIWNLFLFFCRFSQKVVVFCVLDSFVQKKAQPSDGSCNVTSDSKILYKLSRKAVPLFLLTHMENTLWVKNTVLPTKMCLLLVCRYQILIIADIKELLQEMDAFCSNYQHVDCL